MRREPTIPLFLWIATAVLTHLAGYRGVDRVATLVERSQELRHFMASIRRELAVAPPIEVSLVEQQPPEPAPVAALPEEAPAVARPEPEKEPPKAEPPKPAPEVTPPRVKPPELAF